jgi:peptide/nickel transport system ATP-binding protein
MNVCAARHPVLRDHRNGSRAQCWASDIRDGLAPDLTSEETAPLPREEISVADEA